MQVQQTKIDPMLCEEIEVNCITRFGVDGAKTTEAYRKAIAEELVSYQLRGFVAERKGSLRKPLPWYDRISRAFALCHAALLMGENPKVFSHRKEILALSSYGTLNSHGNGTAPAF
jgi:hypothetical protein